MAEALQGKKIVLLWRLLSKAAEGAGSLMMFQTEHSVEKSSDSESTVTKTGTIRSAAEVEEEIPFKSIVAKDDPVFEYINTAIDNGEKLELWEVDTNYEQEDGKYPGKYRQGYLTELSYTANAEDLMEVEGTFATDMKAQKGQCTLTMEQIEAAQYAFRDTVPYVAEV